MFLLSSLHFPVFILLPTFFCRLRGFGFRPSFGFRISGFGFGQVLVHLIAALSLILTISPGFQSLILGPQVPVPRQTITVMPPIS